jgi:hypothetical protein
MRNTDGPGTEIFLINRFKQNATLLLNQPPGNDFEWLFLMQHHGMPTRLLDWSESPLVALYFALRSDKDTDSALWVLLPTELNARSNYQPDYELEIPPFTDEFLINYKPSTIASERRSKLNPMAALAPRNSSRMLSQQGTFTINHREPTPIEDVGQDGAERDYVWRYTLPRDSKQHLRNQLRFLSVNEFQLFPELSSLARL